VGDHAGWTGNAGTSWKGLVSSSKGEVVGEMREGTERQSSKTNAGNRRGNLKDGDMKNENHGGALYNGERQVLYWADVTSEIAFIVPTERSSRWNGNEMTRVVWNVSASSSSGGEHGRSTGSGSGPG